ncbi:hypothetical protein TKK_0006232 [Trichogramma kaykai]
MDIFIGFLIFCALFYNDNVLAYRIMQDTVALEDFEVELVQVLFRHGDRVPDTFERYPNDPYDEEYFKPVGYGQLTKRGMKRLYDTGKMLRERYDKFLGHYKPQEVYAFSTDVDRTKISLQLLLAGLYPPTEESMWNKDLPWQPIPIHYKPKGENFLYVDWSCPTFERLYKDAQMHPEVNNIMQQNHDVLEFVKDITKMKFERGALSVLSITANIQSALAMGLPLPNWCSEETFKILEEVSAVGFKSLAITDPLAKIVVGPTAQVLQDNMQRNEDKKDSRKIYLYSAHDSTVMPFLTGLNIKNAPQLAEYGSAVITEKLRDKDGKSFVRMLFWTGVSEKLIPLELPGCKHICTFEEYKNAIAHILPDSGKKNC